MKFLDTYHIFLEAFGPFVLIGGTERDYSVKVKRFPISAIHTTNHEKLNIHCDFNWRYRSDKNTIYWWTMPVDEDFTNATTDYIKKYYGMVDIKNRHMEPNYLMAHYPMMEESHNSDAQTELDALTQTYKRRGIESFSSINPRYTILHHLWAEKNAQKGSGTQFMTDFVAWADKFQQTLVLRTASKGDGGDSKFKTTTSTNRLKEFYKRFGFKDAYAKKSYRPDLYGNMFRFPQRT